MVFGSVPSSWYYSLIYKFDLILPGVGLTNASHHENLICIICYFKYRLKTIQPQLRSVHSFTLLCTVLAEDIFLLAKDVWSDCHVVSWRTPKGLVQDHCSFHSTCSGSTLYPLHWKYISTFNLMISRFMLKSSSEPAHLYKCSPIFATYKGAKNKTLKMTSAMISLLLLWTQALEIETGALCCWGSVQSQNFTYYILQNI